MVLVALPDLLFIDTPGIVYSSLQHHDKVSINRVVSSLGELSCSDQDVLPGELCAQGAVPVDDKILVSLFGPQPYLHHDQLEFISGMTNYLS